MKDLDVRGAAGYAMKNKGRIGDSTQCGCYYCLKIIAKEEIKEWTDDSETALCPHCGVDSLVPDSTGIPMKEEALQILHEYWFTAEEENDSLHG